MKDDLENGSYFSGICVERCQGLCCDPWWGMVSYTVLKRGGLANLRAFRTELVKGIKERERRIIAGYVTSEPTPRALFTEPEKYNVVVRDIRVDHGAVELTLLAMFAFRCRFLSADKTCALHPEVASTEADVRPPHCAYMGSPEARPDNKGFCRIIHAASDVRTSGAAQTEIERAIATEKDASERYYREGYESAEAAADLVVERLRDYCAAEAPHLVGGSVQPGSPGTFGGSGHTGPPGPKPGRNQPCPCGSGKKYKRCHGSP